MKLSSAATPARLALSGLAILLPVSLPVSLAVTVAVTVAATLSGCSSLDGVFGGDKVDYRTTAAKTQPLEVPPDLTQLARESRYQPQGGVISASAVGLPATAGAPSTVPGTPGVVPASTGGVRVERQGQQRWLVVPQTPEQVWPQLKAFWEQRGFTLAEENLAAGVMETNWAENRAKLPADAIRSALGKVFGNLYDTGERDLYRTRVERTASGSEVYITHRGIEEAYVGERRESTAWRARPNDPQLEAEILTRLMISLGAKEEPARAALAAAADAPARARAAEGAPAAQATSLVLDEAFDRAWRRVGLALDRGGFTVEDRDRAAGLYYVRYIDPKNIGKDEPGWWSKLFGNGINPQATQRYRILVKANGDKTNLSVQNSTGAADVGDNAKRIVALLVNDLR